MGKAKSVVGQAERKTFVPFIIYILISAFFLPPAAMKSYGRSLETVGGFSMNGILQFFQSGNQRLLAIAQTTLFMNSWENQYRKAEAERRQLEFSIAELQRRAEEVEQLRQALDLNRNIRWDHINAEIIAYSGNSSQDSIAIDVGSADGIYQDAPVIGFANGKYGLIGKIQTLGKKRSTVVSLANRYYQLGVTAMLQKSRFQGILSSDGEYYRLDFVNRQARDTVQNGDLVVSVGSKESLYPRGIPIGYISQIEELEYNASLSLLVRPIVELSQIEYVAVLVQPLTQEIQETQEVQAVQNGQENIQQKQQKPNGTGLLEQNPRNNTPNTTASRPAPNRPAANTTRNAPATTNRPATNRPAANATRNAPATANRPAANRPAANTAGNAPTTTNRPAANTAGNAPATTNRPAANTAGNAPATTNRPAANATRNAPATTNRPTANAAGNAPATTNRPAANTTGNPPAATNRPAANATGNAPAATNRPIANAPAANAAGNGQAADAAGEGN